MERKITNQAGKLMAVGMILSFILSPLSGLASVETNPAVPEVISRKAWGADESLRFDKGGDPTWPIENVKVEKFVIHHTASSKLVADADGSGQYKTMMKNLYNYFVASKTWSDRGATIQGYGDFGYNYVIDPNGNIYEGRAGGNGTVGGHAIGFNSGSVGISVLGNYQDGSATQTNTELSPKVRASLERLIGWIAANNSLDLNRVTTFYSKSIDGVVGHKEVYSTSCPGNVIFDQLAGIQAQAVLYAQQYKKEVYQIKGSSAVYVLADGYKTKYDSKSELPDSLQSRAVQYVAKSQLDAYPYKDKKTYPDGTLLKTEEESTVYHLEDGKKRPLGVSEAEFLKLGFKAEDIVAIGAGDLEDYETGALIKFGPEGALVKDASNNVYLLESGKKRVFTSAKLFEFLKYAWTKVKADPLVENYLDGEAMRYPDGTLVRGKDEPSVYLVQGGNRREFTSGALFEKLGYKWSSIVTIEKAELAAYGIGAHMVYPDGTLVRGAGTAAVFLVKGGQKLEFTSATLLGRLGYSFANVTDIPVAALSDYPEGGKASYPDGTLIKAAETPAVYRVAKGGKEEFTSLNVFNASGAKWANVVEIGADEMKLYATNGIVRYPDGTLFRSASGEKIYVMKAGAPVWIRTAEEFTKAGYKWTSVLLLDPAEFALYVNEPAVKGDSTETPITPTVPTPPPADTNTGASAGGNASAGDYVSGVQPNLRVAITSSTGESVKLIANGNYKVEYYDKDTGKLYKTVEKTKSGVLTTEVPFFDDGRYIRFVPESRDVVMEIQSYSDPSWDGKINDNKFRGVIELRYSAISKKLWVIEDVPLEDYLRGISETAGVRTQPEYLKAFAIITRTYAINYIAKGGKHIGEPFHLKNSRNKNGNDQQYKGYNFEVRSAITVASYEQTKGKVIEYNNKPIVAAYSSDSGGVTKDACVVLTSNYCTSDYAYLRGGVKDPAATVHKAASIAASHGAGMSAAGAEQMALEGAGWEQIIKTYYLGVNIDKYY